jgi:hypothetical protein
MPVINEAKRMRQENHEFEARLGYTLKENDGRDEFNYDIL